MSFTATSIQLRQSILEILTKESEDVQLLAVKWVDRFLRMKHERFVREQAAMAVKKNGKKRKEKKWVDGVPLKAKLTQKQFHRVVAKAANSAINCSKFKLKKHAPSRLVTKTGAKRSKSISRCRGIPHGHHLFCADARVLNRICCYHCKRQAFPNNTDSEDTKLLKYLSARRKRRLIANLFNLTIPLASTSTSSTVAKLVKETGQLGVVSNTQLLHLTMLEGVPEDWIDEVDSQVTTDSSASCTVMNFQSIPTNQPGRRLVICNVHFDYMGRENVTDVPQLPQWPLHIALGTVGETQIDHVCSALEGSLMGKLLDLDVDNMAWLGPNTTTWRRGRTADLCREESGST